jgi:hypothetical protein
VRGGMAEIIKRWLRDKVGLDPHQLADSDRAFANGFLFGKLFDGYGVQPDFDKFVNKEAPDAKLANFQRLQPTIRSLNIKFDAHVANQLMTEEPGAAMMLLQQLKVVLDVEPGPGTGGGSRTQTGRSGRSRGSTSLLLTTNRLASKAPYKQMEEQTFFNTLRLKSADPREFRLQNHLRPFEQVAPISPRPTTPPACRCMRPADRAQRESSLRGDEGGDGLGGARAAGGGPAAAGGRARRGAGRDGQGAGAGARTGPAAHEAGGEPGVHAGLGPPGAREPRKEPGRACGHACDLLERTSDT